MKINHTYQGRVETHNLDRETVVVGRPNPYLPPDLDLAADILVSRTHARIWLREGHYWIQDLGSSCGSFVNEVRLEYRHRLRNGDTTLPRPGLHAGQRLSTPVLCFLHE